MGNPGACIEALRKLFNFSSCDGREDCAFAGVYQPPVPFLVHTQLFINVIHSFCRNGMNE